jgi:hypothetical protein
MTDPVYALRSSTSGPVVKGTPSYLLAFTSDGEHVQGVPAGVSGVSSVFGRGGAVVAVANDYAASQVANDSSLVAANVAAALDVLKTSVVGLGGLIAGLQASNIGNDSAGPGANVKAVLDAYNTHLANLDSSIVGLGSLIAGLVASNIGNNTLVSGATVAGALTTLGTGGFRAPVADITARNAVTLKAEGMIVFVTSLQLYYELAADLTTWTIYARSPVLATQTDWFIDQATGNDNNDGKTGHPLATITELNNRLCPFGEKIIFQNSVIVHVAAGTYNELLDLNYDWPPNVAVDSLVLSVQGAISSTSDTLTGVVNSTPAGSGASVRGQLTVVSALFSNHCRIRSTSGANVGAICYSTGLNAGTSNTFVSRWSNYNTASAVNIANGTTIAVDVLLTTIKAIRMRIAGRCYYEVKDVIVSAGISHINESYRNNNGYYWGCKLLSGVNVQGNGSQLTLENCYSLGVTWYIATQFLGHIFGSTDIVSGNSNDARAFGIKLYAANTIDGGKIQLNAGSRMFDRGSSADSTEFVNGAGAPAIVATVGCVISLVYVWGATSTNFSFIFQLQSGAQLYFGNNPTSANLLMVLPATNAIDASGQNVSFAQMPRGYVRDGVVIGLQPDPTATATTV